MKQPLTQPNMQLSMKSKNRVIIVLVALGLSFGLIAQQQSGDQGKESLRQPSESTIASKLEEIVSLREKMFVSFELQLEAGRAPVDGLAEVELAEARIELAREAGDEEALLRELRNLVAAHERIARRLQNEIAAGRMGTGASDRASIALLEAEIRLLREVK
jgi:hypothetical protein